MRPMHPNIILLCVFISCFVSTKSEAQPSKIGIYITVEGKKKKCDHIAITLDGKAKHCVTAEPVLARMDISHITNIKTDLANLSYFTIHFTDAGRTKLHNLSVAFPSAQLVILVDDMIIGFLTNLDVFTSNVLKITAGEGTKQDFELAHQKLALVLPIKK